MYLIQTDPSNMLDPTPFAAFGVLGGLLFAISIMALLVWRLFLRQSQIFEKRDDVLMDFVNTHRKENSVVMESVANKVSDSHDRLASTLSHSLDSVKDVIARHTRKLDDFLLTREVLSRVEQMKRRGDSLDDTVIEKVVRSVLSERRDQ